MGFRDLQPPLALSYRTGRNDMVAEFFVPCLEKASLYRRSAGYFTSHGLALAARGVASLVSRGGEMRLVVSPNLEPEDVEALQSAIDRPAMLLESIVAKSLSAVEEALVRDRLNALAWLAAAGFLKVKLALRVSDAGDVLRGIYHEKVGIFTDPEGDHVAFNGSANETAGGFVENFESFDVFRSWSDVDGRIPEKVRNFEALWSNQTPGLRVIDFTKTSADLLERFRQPMATPVEEDSPIFKVGAIPTIPETFSLRDPQRDALNAWKANDFRGILAMATGAGKTITAIYGAIKIAERLDSCVLVVVCPYINLAEQWCRELAKFKISPIRCYRKRNQWQPQLPNAFTDMALGNRKFLSLVVTNRTFLSSSFQAELASDRIPHILVADEVHNLGASRIRELLPDKIRFRLGLSATPERHRDEEGTAAIFDYFGGVVFEYGIRQAIKDKILCQYHYHPVVVDLTNEEGEEYWRLTQEIGRKFPRDEDSDLPDVLKMLLIRRARLLASCANKLPALSKVLDGLNNKVKKAMIYCGDGRVEDSATEDEALIRQVDAAVRLLGNSHKLNVRRFTCSEPMSEREDILNHLRDGSLDAVVAIRCLDEGIDVPDVRMGFLLASSTNPRQFIQRRGRLLRRAEGKTHADIWDFIVRPPDLGGKVDAETFNLERKLFARELARVVEFCQTAENGDSALGLLADLRRRYNLLAN